MTADCPDETGPNYPYDIENEDDLFVVGPVESSSSEEEAEACQVENGEQVCTYTYERLAELCNDIGLSPEMIDGVLVQLITQHMSEASGLIHPELEDYLWSQDKSQTKLWLYKFTQWPGKDASLPAIVYNDLGQQPQRIAVGDLHYHSSQRPEAEGFARAYVGQHRIMCVGMTDGQAGLLASELTKWLTSFTPWIRQNLPFFDFQVGVREQPKLYEELGNRVGVAFGVSYAYLWAWELVPASPPLKAATIRKDIQ